MQGVIRTLENNSSNSHNPQILWRFATIPDNGWMGCVSVPQPDRVESNGLVGSDVFLKLPSLDLAGDVEL